MDTIYNSALRAYSLYNRLYFYVWIHGRLFLVRFVCMQVKVKVSL
jgi:hypothetical protein